MPSRGRIMNFNLKLGSALLIFITSFTNAFAFNLTVMNDGTAASGNIQVYDSTSALVGSCSLPAGCDPSLTTLPSGNYNIISIPASSTTDVTAGFSACPGGVAVGNSCSLNLSADTTATATFNLRNRFTVYDQDADGIDDLTEFALNANPLAFNVYSDTDNDGLQDILETQLTKTDPTINDSAICSGTGELTGQWDVRWLEGDSIAAGHDLNDADDVDVTDTKKEWVAAFSICHTGTSVKIYDQYFGYATSASFDGTTLTASFVHPFDGTTTFSATYTPAGGLFGKGRFEDLNTTLEDVPGVQMRADRRMELADLADLTATNISGTYAVQATVYDSESDELFNRSYNPGTFSVDFRATETAGKVMAVSLYSTGDSGNANAIRGYYVPSVATYFSIDRTVAQTGIDLDGDTLADDQIFDHNQVSMTFVEAPVNGVGGMYRGELESQELKDIDSDFTNDGIYGGIFGNLYGEGVQPKMSAFTLNVENSSGATAVQSRISLINAQLSAETATLDTPSILADPLFDNLDSDPANNSGLLLSTNNRIEGYLDGERVGSHHIFENNGTVLVIKPGLLETGLYIVNLTGDGLTGTSLSANYTDNTGSPLPPVTNVKIDNASLNTSRSKPRLINTDTTHTLKWNRPAASGVSGSTGANLYRVQISKRNGTVGIDDSGRLESYVTCASSTCSYTLPKNSFDADATYEVRIVAFDNAINSNNRSISAKYYVNTASKQTGCSNNSTNSGAVTNGSPCAEYYQVQNPRIYDNAGTETATFLDYAVNRPVATPKAIVVLLTGGNGNAVIIGNATSKVTKQVGTNSLVRSAEMFADQGYLAVTIDSPSDKKLASGASSYLYDDYRISPALAQDIASVLNEVNTQNLNVFLAGTSRGGISVLNQFKVANAISMSVPVNITAPGYLPAQVSGDHPVGQTGEGEVAPGDVYVPVHYLVNPDESCGVTMQATAGDQTMFDQFTQFVGQNQFDSVSTGSNGVSKIGSTCKSMHDHGFLGSELAMVTATTSWFDGLITSYAGNRPPLTRPVRQLVLSATPTLFEVANLTALASDPDGDPIDVDVASASSTRGGTFVESVSPPGLTYTPPAGVATDAIVFVIEDDKGGRTSMIMTIDISDDVDNDGLPDSIYPADGSTADAESDIDGDGLTLLQEYQSGTDAGLGDTDSDGFSDAFEISNGLNPTVFNDPNYDSDVDGFTDAEEAAVGSNLFDATSNPGYIGLSSGTYSVNEDAGTASITVNRTGGTVGEVTVNCYTTDIAGQASAGVDYTAVVNQTLTWPDGDATPKTCSVPITNDSNVEENETFQIDISAPGSGAKLDMSPAI